MDQHAFLNNLFTRVILVTLIAILVTLFLWQSLQVIKAAPQYEQFCSEELFAKDVSTETLCAEVGGKWEKTSPVNQVEGASAGYCNPTFSCQKEFDALDKEYSGFAFLTLLSAGIILALAGLLIRGNAVVTNGLLGGGVLTIFTSSVSHWSHLFPGAKVLLLGVSLAALIYVTWNKFKD